MKAKFRYVDGMPDGVVNAKTVYGTVMHHALQIFNDSGNLQLAIDEFKDKWHSPEKIGAHIDVWPKYVTYGALRVKGEESIRMYADRCKWDERQIIATEKEFLVPFGKHELNGFVDLVDVRRSGRGKNLLRIVDYKSTSKKPTAIQLGLNLQFTVYSWAVRQPEFWYDIPNGKALFEEFAGVPHRNIWFHLNDGVEMDAGSREEEDFRRMYRLCNMIEKNHESGVFVPNIGEACVFCPYTEPCGVEIPTFEGMREEENAWV